ncbi:MAG: DUF4097 family beta strand repeat-containing protein [Gemmatimonadaceae bacterium]
MYRTLLLPALLVAAALPAAAQNRSATESDIDSTFAFDRRGTVSLSAGNGDIVVTAWDRPQIRVRARSERGVIRMDATSTRLSLDLSRAHGGNTRFEVTVPVGARVSARATAGDVSVSGTRGIVEASTQSGDLTVEDAAEIIELRTYSGDLVARNLAGNVEVNTLNGDMEITGVQGDVEVTSVSGDIELRDVVARYVRAKSTSGDVTFDGSVHGTGRYELGSHSGDIYLVVPQNTGALLSVSTYNGSIESDFPITLKPGEHGMGSTRRFSFDIGQGDARISAESFSGDITIRSRTSNR